MSTNQPSEFFEVAKKDIFPSLKKGYTKKDWLNHARSLIGLNKKTGKVDTLIELIEQLIPRTNTLLKYVAPNKAKDSIFSTLTQELIFLNEILKDLDKNNEISPKTISLIKELDELAEFEKIIIENI